MRREQSIINQWKTYTFPAIPPYNFPYARARLTAFCTAQDWFITFEIVGYSIGAGECLNQIYAFGSKVKTKLHNSHSISIFSPIGEALDFPEDDEGNILLDPLSFTGKFHDNHMQEFSPDSQAYLDLGINLTHQESPEWNAISPIIHILRYLTYKYADHVFLPPATLLALFDQPKDLTLFAQSYEWYHPDWRLKEQVTDSPSLLKLAKALAHCNSALLESWSENSNTHWRNWDEWYA